MRYRRLFAALSFVLIFHLLIMNLLEYPVAAEQVTQNASILEKDDLKSYAEYLSLHKNETIAKNDINISLTSLQASSEAVIEQQGAEDEPQLVWTGEGGTLTGTFYAETSGLYQLEIAYSLRESRHNQIEFGLQIDGKTPFKEATAIALERPYTYEYDDITEADKPVAVMATDVFVRRVRYYGGIYNDPYLFYLEAGEHYISLTGVSTDFVIHKITFCIPETLKTYAQILESYKEKGYTDATGEVIYVQAEQMHQVSDSVISGQYDRSDVRVEPSSPNQIVYNIAGGEYWQSDGQWISWKVTVPQSGLYQMV